MHNNVRNEGELTRNMGKRQNQRNILDFLSSPSMSMGQASGHGDVLQEREKIKTIFCLPEHSSLQ